jgi:hypothetical protein
MTKETLHEQFTKDKNVFETSIKSVVEADEEIDSTLKQKVNKKIAGMNRKAIDGVDEIITKLTDEVVGDFHEEVGIANHLRKLHDYVYMAFLDNAFGKLKSDPFNFKN